MLTLIGLGLCDGSDITLRGKGAIENADAIYIEEYTSLLQCSHDELEQMLGRSITRLSRKDVEEKIEPILDRAIREEIAILVIGDPFGATTHADIVLRAHARSVPVRIIHNASIISAVGEIGLELYKYGKTVSVPFWQQHYEPTSFVDGIMQNHANGLHTLCLLDIKADKNRFMTIAQGIEHLRKAEHLKKTGIITNETLAVGVARLGCDDQALHAGTLEELERFDFGKPPHCLILPGKLHQVEEEMLTILTTKKE